MIRENITSYPPPEPETCRYCGCDVKKKTQKEVYGKNYNGRLVFQCEGCDAMIGTHEDGRPLGILANKELRRWRSALHEAFDPLWKKTRWDRQETYNKVFPQAGIHEEHLRHIGMLDLRETKKLIRYLMTNGPMLS